MANYIENLKPEWNRCNMPEGHRNSTSRLPRRFAMANWPPKER